MKIRTLWNIILKTIGIWFIISLLYIVPSVFTGLAIFLSERYYDATYMIICILIVGFFIATIRLLIFRTDIIIDKLKLEKGFTEESINLNINSSQIISLASIIIGAITIIENLPSLCSEIITLLQYNEILPGHSNTKHIIYCTVKILIGYLLITNHKRISASINKKENTQ